MNSARLTDAEIRAHGWLALIEKLGPSGAVRFALQTERGYGDYADERHKMLGGLSVKELVARMGSQRGKGRRPRRRRGSAGGQ
jgi:hypothetical protein